ncbi:medium chain dehydrogenase/reductase family protein [Gaetbulibacter sp. M240]|uniref:medium chain dehydrogenase/reductase family protein n=1 Tax=Gaetbulibacter sp. M240 TaxID=3126511 RepID=UPI00374F512B
MSNKSKKIMSYRYISLKEFGGPEVLELEIKENLPEPNEGEVRVKVLATSINFTDTLIRRGIYPDVKAKPPITPGYDMVGIVDKLGFGVTDFTEGQKVAELTVIGAYSEYLILPAKQLVHVPENVNAVEAVSMILSYVTAYQMLTRSANIKEGNKILIHGAGGAVGSALLQIGSLFNLKMFGTASADQHDILRESGCHPINYKSEDFVQVIRDLEPNGLDAVFDPFGGDHFKRSIKTLNNKGKLVAFGAYNAKTQMDLIKSFLRVQIWNLTPWMPSTSFYSIGSWHKKRHGWFESDLKKLFVLLSEKKLKPLISKTIKIEEAKEAHELIEKGGLKGKLVIKMNN